MRPLTPSLILSLILLLAACSNTKDKAFKDDISEANFKLGIGYMQSGYLDVAAEKLLKAVQYNERYPEAHNALGVLYEEIREYGPAETHFKQALALKPDYTLAKLNYARLLCGHEPVRTAEGESEFQKIADDPANAGSTAADAYAGLGLCARRRNDPTQAETWLRKALEMNPDNTTALYEMAELSHEQGKTLQGRAFLQRYHSKSRVTAKSLSLGIAIESVPNGNALLRREYSSLLSSQFPDSEEAQRLKQPQ